MKYICALITVSDIQRSRYLYETILNQKVVADYGDNVAFEGSFAIHRREHFRELINNKDILEKSNSCELYFEENDIDALEKLIKKNNLEFVHETREQPWRQKVIRFYDYDGNIIEAGETMEYVAYRLHLEGKPTDEICKITYLTEETVKTAVSKYGGC